MTGKKVRKTGLGRGISALIPDIEPMDEKAGSFFMCDIENIVPNRFQPRTIFSEEDLENLKNSIIEQGILQPVLVRQQNDKYELIAGERRYRAAQRANLTRIPAIIRELSDEQVLEVSIIENIQRANLNPLEEAEAYHRLITEFKYTQEMVAQKIGKNRSTITNFLRLRKLPEVISQSLSKNQISMGHARALLGAGAQPLQIKAWETVISKDLSVRATEQLVKKIKEKPDAPEKKPVTPETEALESICNNLTQKIQSSVKIKKKGNRGKLEISFKNEQEFQKLIQLLDNIS
ncbi:chromosome partitioning protein, ParB family [Desulfocicer vacuolatum DSM 3385]|uniref:Chromosome partitioning protein, ParB family n=1 Tax=Desulfocicer vacuolatum DSM 3385 TaxID=1121400 RepID=A0A1W2BIS2_9BACT|nr:ParB/RepB/Spo0J family partition protein [Desulfocicer vacuolatum]SMC72773.1 chromosome partitioning protein, ParB family [Desulfocicer vacuolatum DSM 3385]